MQAQIIVSQNNKIIIDKIGSLEHIIALSNIWIRKGCRILMIPIT